MPHQGQGNEHGAVLSFKVFFINKKLSELLVALPALQELSGAEIGPLIASDWLCNVGLYMRDMSTSRSGWWDTEHFAYGLPIPDRSTSRCGAESSGGEQYTLMKALLRWDPSHFVPSADVPAWGP